MKIGIIGAGLIGSELARKAQVLGWDIRFVVDSMNVYRNGNVIDCRDNYHCHVSGVDIGFIAIPTKDDGTIAYNYLQMFLAWAKPVVTCEKGAFSNYFPEIEQRLHRVGYTASVGGGSRLLRYAEELVTPSVNEVHAILNGTLNYVFSGLSNKKSLEEICLKARESGYAEPGATEPLDIINAEASGDIPRKAVILFNICNLTKDKLRLKHIPISKLSKEEYNALLEDAPNRRYIVSITNGPREENVIGGFCLRTGDWVLSAGFKDINGNPLYQKLLTDGIDNALLIKDCNGIYKATGPGAGAGPTTDAMIADAMRLSKII